jgi:hypothetical protein
MEDNQIITEVVPSDTTVQDNENDSNNKNNNNNLTSMEDNQIIT